MFLSHIQTIKQKGGMEMKTKGFIMLAVLISCFLWINGAWAETKGYIDSGQNSITGYGVVGAEYRGTTGRAIDGWASASTGYTYGGYFQSNSTSGTGVYGYAQASAGGTCGGEFASNSTGGTGVRGWASASTGYTYGGDFRSNSTSGRGVQGYASASTGDTYGGSFGSNSTNGTGVKGWAPASTGYTYGGDFRSSSTSGTGVRGYAEATTGTNYGGYFRSSSTSGRGVYSWALASTGYTYGGYFQSNSTSGRGVYGYAPATTGINYGVYGRTNSPSGYGVYSQGRMMVIGNFTATGTKSAVVKLKNGESVSLYAVEASENWFEDFGSSTLKKGSALVKIDPTFAETVNTDKEYHVFLTPNGDCKGLYVTNKKGTSFEVRELNGGKSGISFSYRIVAKRKGYESQRLAKVNEDKMTVMATNEAENMQKGEAMELASHGK